MICFERAIALDGSAGAASPRSHMAKVVMDNDGHVEARGLLTLLLDETMETGDLYSASTHLFHLAELDVWAGDWPSAIEHAEESLQLTAAPRPGRRAPVRRGHGARVPR